MPKVILAQLLVIVDGCLVKITTWPAYGHDAKHIERWADEA